MQNLAEDGRALSKVNKTQLSDQMDHPVFGTFTRTDVTYANSRNHGPARSGRRHEDAPSASARRCRPHQSSANPGSFADTGGNGWVPTKANRAVKPILLHSAERSYYSISLPRGLLEDGAYYESRFRNVSCERVANLCHRPALATWPTWGRVAY